MPDTEEKLREAAQAVVDFHNGPPEAKRPDVFAIRMMRLENALSLPERKEGDSIQDPSRAQGANASAATQALVDLTVDDFHWLEECMTWEHESALLRDDASDYGMAVKWLATLVRLRQALDAWVTADLPGNRGPRGSLEANTSSPPGDPNS